MRKIVKVPIIIAIITIVVMFFLLPLSLFAAELLLSASSSGHSIYKTMNYGKYDIVIISRRESPLFPCNSKLYAEVWSNHKQVHNYLIFILDAPDEYNTRIKDIRILPDTGKIKVEFTDSGRMIGGKDIEFKIAEVEATYPVVTVP